MTYTLHNIPVELDRALRERAAAEHKSLDLTIIESLARGVGIDSPISSVPKTYRDLSDIAGSGGIDDEIEAFLWEQRRIDPEIWQ
jgi:hypothetical protein